MTLIVAGIEQGSIWMVGDTAITEGTIGLRERIFKPKIEVARNFPALIAFAGGFEFGSELAREAAHADAHGTALKILEKGTAGSDVQCAFATFVDEEPKLYLLEQGKAIEQIVLHIGSTSAFNDFQRIRHSRSNPYSPKALKTFMCGVSGLQLPEVVVRAIHSMIEVFASREERDVGGWAVPYILDSQEAHFCSYCYSVSDPVFDELVPGSLVAHGTAQGGGSNLSVTGLPDHEGMVIYWLQIPGGQVVLRTSKGYEQHNFKGGPTAFKEAV